MEFFWAKHYCQKGISLIELIVIISILFVLLASAAPPLLEYYPNLQLSAVARDLVSDIRYAQQLAITEQKEYAVCFFSSGGGYERRYQVIEYGECGVSPFETEKEFEDVDIAEVNLTLPEVVFNPYGASRESGTIVLVNSNNATSTIDVRPSGFVKIID